MSTSTLSTQEADHDQRLCMGLFLAALDTTIVSTSLVTITKSLKAWSRSSWIVTSYLLTYTGTLPRSTEAICLSITNQCRLHDPMGKAQ